MQSLTRRLIQKSRIDADDQMTRTEVIERGTEKDERI